LQVARTVKLERQADQGLSARIRSPADRSETTCPVTEVKAQLAAR
jgi:hypothetical protein